MTSVSTGCSNLPGCRPHLTPSFTAPTGAGLSNEFHSDTVDYLHLRCVSCQRLSLRACHAGRFPLEELAACILDVLGFDGDHYSEFYVANTAHGKRGWSLWLSDPEEDAGAAQARLCDITRLGTTESCTTAMTWVRSGGSNCQEGAGDDIAGGTGLSHAGNGGRYGSHWNMAVMKMGFNRGVMLA